MINIFITNKTTSDSYVLDGGSVVFGRRPDSPLPRKALRDDYVSANHLKVDELPGGAVRLQNLSTRVPVTLATGEVLPPGGAREATLPLRLTLGETILQLQAAAPAEASGEGMRTIARPLRVGLNESLSRLPLEREGMDATTLARWFEGLMSVQRASVTSGEFFRQTAQALVNMFGLDLGMVLQRRGGDWTVLARHDTAAGHDSGYSRLVLDRVSQEKQTFIRQPSANEATQSLMGVSAVVAAPVFDDEEQVIGALYGARFRQFGALGVAIGSLEAQLVQVLAASVTAGLARVQAEADAARRRVQFEQFFSPELARELDRDPNLLDGTEREVTVLFSDIRGFSRISERLTPRDVCLMAQDVMDRLTEQVRRFGGTVVSYSGDGMMALWNAPVDQPDHAVRACRAALAMQAELPTLNAVWGERTGTPIKIGIGLNTGRALVGNTGSRSKFMYGPQGHTVNLASRVEGATKQLGSPVLITESTNALLADAFATRRLCRVRVQGIDGAVDLYELHSEAVDAPWGTERDTYEMALRQYESKQWWDACRTLYPLIAGRSGEYDMPALILIGRCIECLKSKQTAFDPVLDLLQK